MKFDVVIGNPPYQQSSGGLARSDTAKPFYQNFMLRFMGGQTRYLSFIIPAKWYTNNAHDCDKARSKTIKNLKILKDFPQASEVFEDIQLSGGLCIYLWEHGYKGKTNFIQVMGEDTYTSYDDISDSKLVIRYDIGRRVVAKVAHFKEMTLNEVSIVSSKFGIPTYERGEMELPGQLKLRHSGGWGWASLIDVTRNIELIPLYKVIIGYKVPGGGLQKNHRYTVITIPQILRKDEVCTDTYQVIGAFKDAEQAQNYMNYFKTKFVRFLMLMTQTNSSTTRDNYQLIPIQDFTINWTDEDLYKKYGLDNEEIEFIEKLIRPMFY